MPLNTLFRDAASNLRAWLGRNNLDPTLTTTHPDAAFYRNASQQIESYDHSLFPDTSQTGKGDKQTLLALQNTVRHHAPGYTYIEVGSHLGGTLAPHLADPLCMAVYSIDKRPSSQLDERGLAYQYPDNSTQRMLATLRVLLPASSLGKLHTFDTDASEVTRCNMLFRPDLALIDAEHTNVAVCRDFLSIHQLCKGSSVVMFHDVGYVADAILNIESFLAFLRVRFASYILPDSICVMLFNDYVDIAGNAVGEMSLDKGEYISTAKTALWQEIARNNAV